MGLTMCDSLCNLRDFEIDAAKRVASGMVLSTKDRLSDSPTVYNQLIHDFWLQRKDHLQALFA